MSYNLLVRGEPMAQLTALWGLLADTADVPSGCRGDSARVTGLIRVTSLDTLQIGSVALSVPVYRLPGAVLHALLAESGTPIPDVAALVTLLGGRPGRNWWSAVQDVASGPTRVSESGSCGPLQQTAQWQPGETRLTHDGRRLILTLTFDVHTVHMSRPHDTVIGIDVGQTPLAVAIGSGFRQVLPGLPPLPPPPPHLPDAVLQLGRAAVYGAARQQWEALLAVLLPRARVVAVEALNRQGLQARFRQQCGAHAINDALLAWLPQLAREVGVTLVRVDPAGTSRTCPVCLRPGERRGARLHCAVHGPLNVHEVAATWIARLGAAQVLQGQQARLAARRLR